MATRKVSVGAISAVAATAVVLNVLVAAVLITYQRVPNIGDVKAVGVDVYWDDDCTSELTSIDWGFLNSGATSNVTIYIKNEGNIPVVLNVTTDNWNPASASDHMMLSWNREGYMLNSDYVVQAVLTLSVSSGIGKVRSFSFDMTITGTEYA